MTIGGLLWMALRSWRDATLVFAGVPLAFAFLATLGRLGLVTILLRDVFGFNLGMGKVRRRYDLNRGHANLMWH